VNPSDTVPSSIGSDGPGKSFADEPAGFFGHSLTRMQTMPQDALAALQLCALQYRFAELRLRIPLLKKLAERQDIHALDSLDDAVPLLFEHTMYKSYPPSLLEQGRFSDINRWLSRLTSLDLSAIDVSGCESIDEWLDVMDRESPLTISHSSGTSGTMSFLPTSKAEWEKFGRLQQVCLLQAFREQEQGEPRELYCVYPYFRDGGSAHLRTNDMLVKHVLGSEDRFIAAYPGRMSSDVLYLAGKLRAAQARGDLDRLQIPARLLRRKQEFEALQASMPAHLDRFFDEVIDTLRGRRVFLGATWNIVHGLAARGLAQGLSGVFSADSIILSGGGAKGMTPPPNWQEEVCRFFGVERLQMGYGMSEVMGIHSQCEHGHYHFVPWVIPFLLDPETGQPLPRKAVATGRAAFFDLGSETRWGGFITGDEITVNWTAACPCGRSSAYIQGEIQRYSDKKGGDDKISCAATENAHKEALDFLQGLE
jgi:hypothetical protein